MTRMKIDNDERKIRKFSHALLALLHFQYIPTIIGRGSFSSLQSKLCFSNTLAISAISAISNLKRQKMQIWQVVSIYYSEQSALSAFPAFSITKMLIIQKMQALWNYFR